MIPKFRAYSDSRHEIHEVAVIDWQDEELLLTDSWDGLWASFEDVVLMQSTGLKDKNGVEIFDGDVIPSNYTTFSKGELKVQVVRFLDGGFRRLSVHRKWGPHGAYGEAEIADWHDQGCLSKDAAMETEVLGNIYENPELLEVADDRQI